MHSLELKIPPPALAALIAIAMWGLSSLAPLPELPAAVRLSAALALALAGGAFSLAGVVSFRRARTTVNPMKPQAASSLVSSGVYGVSRNPMYLGLLLVVLGWAALLWSAWALLGPPAFFLYMGRFQIRPEERVLAQLFGAGYAAYTARVRRWL